MLKTPFLSGFHFLFGRAKVSQAAKLKKKMDEIREHSPSELNRVFSSLIEPEKIAGLKNSRRRIFTPSVTFWMMLSQAFRKSSMRDAVREAQAWLSSISSSDEAVIDGSTGSYSDARMRLPQEEIDKVNERICSKSFGTSKLLGGRRIMVVDGTGLQSCDTEANQDSYPQPSSQAEGCGFPAVQMVALMNLKSGMIEHYSLTPQDVNEGSVFNVELVPSLRSSDVLVADRGFCSYIQFAQLQNCGVDLVMRLNGSREWPKNLKGDEGIVEWKRPAFSSIPDHITEEEWSALPEYINVRYVRRIVKRDGFRDQVLMVVTSIEEYHADEILQVYLKRWNIEQCFDNIKTIMGLDFINAKTPEMLRKVISIHVIAYNLIRSVIQTTAIKHGIDADRISFKGSLDALLQFTRQMRTASGKARSKLMEILHEIIAKDLLPYRPNRIEPRVVKRRPKPFPIMTKSRIILRAEIINAQRA